MRYLRSITSLHNLKSGQPGGQIATLLIIMMVVVLIFVLVTINMGSVSARATRLANAADSTTLLLASKLATQAYMLAQQIGGDEVCVKGGLLAIVLAVILAVIALILAAPTSGQSITAWLVTLPAILTAAAAGAIGGAIGGAIVQGTFKGAVMGAIQGAVIGASIAWGAGKLGAALGTTTIVPVEGAMTSAATGAEMLAGELPMESLGLGIEASMLPGYSAISGVPLTATVVTPSLTGMLIGAALPVAGSVYNGVVEENMQSEALENLAKMLTTLPQYDAMREELFFHAFTQVVDNPNQETDKYDLDGDFDHNEKIPAFENWWYDHVKNLQGQFTSGAPLIQSFAEETLIPAMRQVKLFLPDMDRRKIECDCLPPPSELEVSQKSPGPMEQLFRAVYAVGGTAADEISNFWLEGPSQSAIVRWYKRPTLGVDAMCECLPDPLDPEYICTCLLPGIDYFDGLRMEYEEFIDWAHSTLAADDCDNFFYDANDLDKRDDWLELLYKPDDKKKHRGDFYDTLSVGAVGPEAPGLGKITELGVKQWIEHIIRARDALPACKLSYVTSNAPLNTSNQINQMPPYCHEYDYEESGSLYPCNWKLINKNLTGTVAVNPACKLYAEDVTNINNEISYLADYIMGQSLMDRIKQQIINQNPCGADNNPTAGITSCVLQSIDNVIIMQLRLVTTGKTTRLYYTYTYDYTCICCQNNDCCTCKVPLDENGNCPDCEKNTCCSQIPTSHTGATGSGNVTLKLKYLVNIPYDGSWLSRDGFLAALAQISDTLANLPSDGLFATINDDLSNDEFTIVLDKLQNQYDFLMEFLPEVKVFYDKYQKLKAEGRPRATNTGGISPAYMWEDKEGDHSVIVETGKAKFSKVSREEHGNFLVNKKCLVVEKVNPGHAWVKITRRDPGGKNFISSGTRQLGFQWNPGFGQWQTITRKARALYGPYTVGIRDIWNGKRADGKFPGEN